MPQSSSAQPAGNRHWGFSTAGRVLFGWGVLEELRNVKEELGKRVMICTDANIVKSGIAERVETLLKAGGAEVLIFPGGRPEVDLATIESSASAARDFASPFVPISPAVRSTTAVLYPCFAALISVPAQVSSTSSRWAAMARRSILIWSTS